MTTRRSASSFLCAVAILLALGCAKKAIVATPPTPQQPQLILNSLSPDPGSTVKEDTVITANLSYRIPNFQHGQYFVCAQFPINKPDASSDGDFPNKDYPVLVEPEGQLQFRFPMKYVWNRPEVVRPFRVWFYVNRKMGAGDSIVVAKTGPIEYRPQ
jgi:hypothetical protein